MHNINLIHRSFFPTALPHRLPFLFLFLALPFFALACFLALPNSCPAYFLDLPMPTSFCLCLLPMPISSVFCLFPCPAYFCALPVSLPCLFPCPAYFRALPIYLLFFMSARCTGIELVSIEFLNILFALYRQSMQKSAFTAS